MDLLTLHGFRDELEKIAYGPAEAQKVLGLAKKIQLPKASGRVVPTISGGPSLKKGLGEMTRQLVSAGAPSHAEARAAAMEASQLNPATALMGKKPVIMPGQGHLPVQMNQASMAQAIGQQFGAGSPPYVPAQQQKMLHGILKGHELDEASVRGAVGAGHLGHRSPDVLYREHNRLATMPPGHEQLQKYMQYHRGVREAPFLFDQFGLHYGQGPRLSRHARRRLTTAVGNRAMAIQNMAPEAQQQLVEEWNARTPAIVKKYMGSR